MEMYAASITALACWLCYRAWCCARYLTALLTEYQRLQLEHQTMRECLVVYTGAEGDEQHALCKYHGQQILNAIRRAEQRPVMTRKPFGAP